MTWVSPRKPRKRVFSWKHWGLPSSLFLNAQWLVSACRSFPPKATKEACASEVGARDRSIACSETSHRRCFLWLLARTAMEKQQQLILSNSWIQLYSRGSKRKPLETTVFVRFSFYQTFFFSVYAFVDPLPYAATYLFTSSTEKENPSLFPRLGHFLTPKPVKRVSGASAQLLKKRLGTPFCRDAAARMSVYQDDGVMSVCFLLMSTRTQRSHTWMID